jgi:hypothetical protein
MARGHTYVKISYDAEDLTHFGGALLLHQFFRRLGLRKLLSEGVRVRWRNARYTFSDMVLAVVYPIVLGLGRLETTSWMRHNGAFQYLTGLERYPDPMSLRRFLTRMGHPSVLRKFEALHDRLRVAFFGKRSSVTFDVDATVVPVYGHQKGAKVGFNPTKPGRPSYLPQLCVDGQTGDCWAARLLPGNANLLWDIQALLDHAMLKLPAGVRRVRLRADSALYDGKRMSYLEARKAGYTIVARITGPLANRLAGVTYKTHRGRAETGQVKYQATTWEQRRRIIVVRRPVPEESSWQLTLFRLEQYVYQAIVTNLELRPLYLWRFYNDRARIELAIREWKHGWGMGKMPRNEGAANAAWFHLVMFAFNLLNWFKRACVPPELRKVTIPTLRQRLLNVPAALVRPQGKPVMKLPAGYPYRSEFEETLRRIRRFRVLKIPRIHLEPWFTNSLEFQ